LAIKPEHVMGGVVPGPDTSRLGSLVQSGVAWSALLVGARNVGGILAAAILARLLSPDDYGLLGMVATITAFLQVLANLGLDQTTLQRRSLSQDQVSNLFWVNTVMGVFLFALMAVSGPLLSTFFGRSELSKIAFYMGATFLLSGLSIQPAATLRRRMRFRTLTFVELAAFIVGTIVAVLMALKGFGYWALVGRGLADTGTRAVLLLFGSGFNVLPLKRGVGTLPLLGFGGWLTGTGLLVYLRQNVDRILIGRRFGAADLGNYGRAFFLGTLPATTIHGVLGGVMLPALSALQGEKERLGVMYRRAVVMLSLVSVPFAVLLIVGTSEIVLLVYGPQWLGVVPLLKWLGLAAVRMPIAMTMGWLIVAVGKSRVMFYWTILDSIVTITAYVVGMKFGLSGVPAAYSIAAIILTVPGAILAHRVADLRLGLTVNCLFPVLVSAILMGVGVLMSSRVLIQWELPVPIVFFIKIIIGFSIYCLTIVFLARNKDDEFSKILNFFWSERSRVLR
jgi:PST family polysaccharide transporter